MVEEASPVWCTNSLVTRNHNIMKLKIKKKEEPTKKKNHRWTARMVFTRDAYKKIICVGFDHHRVATYVWNIV